MANPYFKFKQFTVWHDKCAMKVGTDGVLLGALAPALPGKEILDVGTGTGLIALMLAQRSMNSKITALDIDKGAFIQATENVLKSPWSDRIEVLQQDFCSFAPGKKYDLIVSNPPYFVDSLLPPREDRSRARHTETLSFEDLLVKSAALLSEKGNFSVIIPRLSQESFCALAKKASLELNRVVYIQTRKELDPKRVVLDFSFQKSKLEEQFLLLEIERHKYSPDYIKLTEDFYLSK